MAATTDVSVQQQKLSFHERLRRIEKGGRHTSQHVYCGPVEEVAALQAGGAKGRMTYGNHSVAGGFLRSVTAKLVAAPMALVIGIAAVLGARILRESFLQGGLAGENAAQMFAYDLGIAVIIALIVRKLLPFRGAYQWMTVLGLVGSLVLMHNFVHTNPDLFASLFTQEWVNEVVATTKEGTLLVAGNTVTF
jgi:hypothetical protein